VGAEVALIQIADGDEEGAFAGAVHVDEGAVNVPEEE
jgi:hypothetical protein